MPTIGFVANRGYALTSSRTQLIKHLLNKNFRVVIVTAMDEHARMLEKIGCELICARFDRGGLSPREDWTAYRTLHRVYRQYSPSLVQHFHAKPVIFGSLAARRALGASVRIVNTITGLGHAFITGGLAARLAGVGYRTALPRADAVIFQNRDDRALFLNRKWVSQGQTKLIAGSGVDLNRFQPVARDKGEGNSATVVMLGRLLAQKGILEFVEAARRIRRQLHGVKFILAGEEDPAHPDALDPQWVRSQTDIQYLGRLSDVRPLLDEADLLLFPSYREGVPRVVLEAAAAGLPTVAFDVPGVREAVRDGETGYLVAERDVDALVAKVEILLDNKEMRQRMGKAARRLAEEAFDINAILAQYLNVYQDLGLRVTE